MHVQGFSGRAATTTIHNATETGLSISGIFQAPEDFAVLCLYNAYDYFNHLRTRPLPRTDLTGVRLQFDLEYDHALEGAIRFDAAKYPSVSWDSMTFVCGKGEPADIYEVRLRDYATVLDGEVYDSYATLALRTDLDLAALADVNRPGIDYIHLYFRDTRYTVTHIDARVEAQIEEYNPTTGELRLAEGTPFPFGAWAVIDPGAATEEMVRLDPHPSFDRYIVSCSFPHEAGCKVRLVPGADAMIAKLVEIINTPGEEVAGRYGPDQTGTISAIGSGNLHEARIMLTFRNAPPPDGCYGVLGNLDRVFACSGHAQTGPPAFAWEKENVRFQKGDNERRYHIDLDFGAGLKDKLNRDVPLHDVRKIYMVFAPRFENVEGALEDGCTLAADVGPSDTVWQVEDSSALSGGRYFIGTPTSEERVRLLSVDSSRQITVERGFEGSTPGSWGAGTRMKKLSPISGFSSDIEWRATISNLTVTGDRLLKVGGGAPRIEESDARCKYTGFWEDYTYGGGFPTQWWSMGHARRCAPNNPADIRKVTIRYSYQAPHDLYLGTFLYTNCGKISVSVDGDPATTHDLYLNEYGGTTANLKLRTGVPAGNRTVEITALFDRNPASGGYYFYFDYLWPLEPVDVPEPPQEYPNVSLAIDFDTDHGYRKPPAWHLWQLGYGETLQQIVSHFRAAINGMFVGVWADDNFGTSTTLRIQSKAPQWTFFDNAATGSPSVTAVMDDHLGTPGAEGDWELIDAVSPVMTEGARRWIRDLAGQFAAAGIAASFAFSMEVYRPPAEMAARYWDGAPVELEVPSTQMHFGARVRHYLKQMYKECADQIAAAGLPVVLQFGETQWWYFPNASGMPFYDAETKAAFEARCGRPMHRFLANTDDPNEDIQTADFLRDRIYEYCQEVIAYVRQFHPTAVFECLWPLDANQGKPAFSPEFRALNFHINLPNEWKTSAYGVKYFRAEGFDYDVWQKNAIRMRQTMEFPRTLGRPPEECMYLTGIYGPPDPPIAQAYGMWRNKGLYSFCFWAFDQFCLNSRPVPLEVASQAVATAVSYHKPRASRALPVVVATPVAPAAAGALNRFKANERRLNLVS